MARVVTNSYRERIARLIMGEAVLPPVPAVAVFGSDGLDKDGYPHYAEIEAARTSLRQEFHRIAVAGKERLGNRVIVHTVLDGNLTGEASVSEMGLLDQSGALLVYDTFPTRDVGPGTLITFRFTLFLIDYKAF